MAPRVTNFAEARAPKSTAKRETVFSSVFFSLERFIDLDSLLSGNSSKSALCGRRGLENPGRLALARDETQRQKLILSVTDQEDRLLNYPSPEAVLAAERFPYPTAPKAFGPFGRR